MSLASYLNLSVSTDSADEPFFKAPITIQLLDERGKEYCRQKRRKIRKAGNNLVKIELTGKRTGKLKVKINQNQILRTLAAAGPLGPSVISN